FAEHVAREQGVPSRLGDDPYPAAVFRIGADVQVLHEQLALRRMLARLPPQMVAVLRLDRPVHLAPVDRVAYAGLVDDEAVLRAAAGVWQGRGGERPLADQRALATGDRELHERSCGQI